MQESKGTSFHSKHAWPLPSPVFLPLILIAGSVAMGSESRPISVGANSQAQASRPPEHAQIRSSMNNRAPFEATGASQAAYGWSPLGSGVSEEAFDLLILDSQLVVTGLFTEAGGMPADRMAVWDGAAWSVPVDAPVGHAVTAMGVYDSQLVVACLPMEFAAWNGSSWSFFGGGFFGNAVYDVLEFDSLLIVGGDFSMVGNVPANNIAAWNGTSWSALGSGVSNTVVALFEYNSQLIVGGLFTTAGGNPASRVAAWNGSTWSPLGTGTGSTARTFVEYGSELIVGGDLGRPVEFL